MSDASAGLTIRTADACRWDLVSLGEVMLRFDPGEERIAGARNFRVWEGGGEYNVARGLRRCFGRRTSIVTALADNSVGRLLEDLMLEGGVDLSHLRWVEYDGIGREARNGIYFLERGFGLRGAMGMMDRGHTPISQMKPGQVDWDGIFGGEGVRWFHTGGVMCALSMEAPTVAREAMVAAQRHGLVVSYDCNYRPSLWKNAGGRQGASDVNRMLAPFVDVMFGHEGDLAAVLGDASHGAPWHSYESYGEMASRVCQEFGNIKVIATTTRRPKTANRNDWGAFGYSVGKVCESIRFDDLEVLDRVGGGDSFAAGLIYGLMEAKGLQWALDCGVAHGALAMTTPGDSSMATLGEVERVMAGGSAGVQR
ncbi:sugar kinase [Tunturibacter empetritectus]|uniref:2-dehydro-3-deoxygluconokinase n=1 Tax=Tunturiibacter lichenicola TaxID=2051959 RepID=A0A7W8N4Y5_9BACT|nr:sugar kinase [Edaphobacter lichenicola]MBB5344041.1 2-dehydro-3-deoxygluconokinase [Edaphobacter lichenicola]